MKKFFTLFAAALMGLAAFAQEGTTSISYEAVATDNAAATQINIIVDNSSPYLNSIQQGIIPESGAEFVKTGTGMNKKWFWPNGAYILALFPDATDDERNQYINDFADIQQSINEGRLVMVAGLKTNDCYFYPATKGQLGYFTMDLSAMPDGDEVTVATLSGLPAHSAFSYKTPENPSLAVPPVETPIKVKKNGNNVEPITGINTVETIKNVTSVKYYNLQGIESATPFDGVNIMVKTFDDGSKATVKVVK